MQDLPRRTAFGTGVLVLATLGMALVLWPFWQAVFWAVVLAILFWPLRQKAVRRLGGRTALASLLIVLLILVFVFMPAFLIGGLVVEGAAEVVKQIQSGAFRPEEFLGEIPTRFPRIAELVSELGLDIGAIKANLGQVAASVAQFAVTHVAAIGQGASALLLSVFLALYVLFALLQDGDEIYRSFSDSFPASRHNKERFFGAFSGMAVATIKGMVSVGLVQAILGGAIFWFLGIGNAVFWGALMGLLSVVPPFGAGFIWGPAGIMMLLNGNTSGGLILLAFGGAVISMSDDVVRPLVVGRSSSVPGYMVLVTTLGGLAMFGLTGLVLGPVLAALFLSAWQLSDEIERQAPTSIEPDGSAPPEPLPGEESR